MPTEGQRPSAATWARLRARAAAFRGWAASRGPATRGVLALATLLALASGGYFAINADSGGTSTLFDGRSLPPDDASAVKGALDVAAIPCTLDARGRVRVADARLDDARKLLAKKGLGPRTVRGLDADGEAGGSIFDSPAAREAREQRTRRRKLAVMIEEIPEVAAADLEVSRERTRPGYGAPTKVTAMLRLVGRDGGPIPHKTIDAIRSMLKGGEPGLPDEGIMIFGAAGESYYNGADPTSGALSEARARAEELRGKLHQQLAWLDGVQVWVEPAATVEVPAPPAPRVSLNHTLSAQPPPTVVAARGVGKVNVMVDVPNATYLKRFRAQMPTTTLSREAIAPLVQRDEASIRQTVAFAAGAELGTLALRRIEPTAPEPPTAPNPDAEAYRSRSWWLFAAAALLFAATLILAAGRRVVGRRPSAAAPPRPPHFAANGPAERVRDLVRADPEAAAGVLNRWIGTGEGR